MRDTGTAHLMAISGLHIAFAALLAAGLIRGGQVFLPGCWIHWQMPLIGGICCAAFYAWLTGMQPPALRTVVALAIWGMLKLSGRQWSGWDVWLCCLAAILLMDPVAILSQSLWLSAAAVAALILVSVVSLSGVAAAAGIARGCFPHPSATGNHPPAYARANCHISWH